MTTLYFSIIGSGDVSEKPFNPLEKVTCPLFGKPKEIGHFSVHSNRDITFDKCQMKYLTFPADAKNVLFDLKVNFNEDKHHTYVTIDKIYQTLSWLLYIKKSFGSFSRFCHEKLDFITVRGTLASIFCTPYIKGSYRDQWEICAAKFQGIIYFAAIDSDKDIEENENLTPKLAEFQAWGYKFEQYMTSDKEDGESNMSSSTHEMEEFCIVLQNKIAGYSLLYKAEIDAVIPHRLPGPGSGDTSCYTELKTHKSISSTSQSYRFYKHKARHWWAQSYLAGIPEIICGFRDDDGIVKEVEVFRVSDFPRKSIGLWSDDVCLSFCEKFLTFLTKTVVEDDPSIVYRFCYRGEDTIFCSKMTQPSSRHRILPEWYIEAHHQEFRCFLYGKGQSMAHTFSVIYDLLQKRLNLQAVWAVIPCFYVTIFSNSVITDGDQYKLRGYSRHVCGNPRFINPAEPIVLYICDQTS